MLASYIFRPKISIYSRKAAIDSAFVRPLYKGGVSINYRVFYIAAFCIFITSFYCRFCLESAHPIISIVDLYLY